MCYTLVCAIEHTPAHTCAHLQCFQHNPVYSLHYCTTYRVFECIHFEAMDLQKGDH